MVGMVNYRSLHLRKAGVFKKVDFQLDVAPLTFIRGRNYDGGLNDSNAVGKTQLWSAMPTLIEDEPLIAGGRSTIKELLPEGAIGLKFDVAGDKHDYEYWLEGTKRSFYEDGADLKIKKQVDVKAEARRYLRCNIEQFYATQFVPSIRENKLLRGVGAERTTLFESLLGLDEYDRLREALREPLKKAREARTAVNELKAVLPAFVDTEALRDRVDRLRDELEDFQGRHRRNAEKRAWALAWLKHGGIDKAAAARALRDAEERVDLAVRAVRDEEKVDAAWVKWETYKDAQRSEVRLKAELQDLPVMPENSERRLADLRDLATSLAALESGYNELVAIERKLGDAPYPKGLDRLLAELEADISVTERHLQAIGKETTCPTCGQAVDERHIERQRDFLADAEPRLARLKLWARRNVLLGAGVTGWDSDKLQEAQQEQHALVEEVTKAYQAEGKRRDILRELNMLDKVLLNPVDKPAYADRLKEARAELQYAEAALAVARERHAQATVVAHDDEDTFRDRADAEEQLAIAEDNLATLGHDLRTIEAELLEARDKLSRAQSSTERRNDVLRKIESHEMFEKHYAVLNDAWQSLGPTGARLDDLIERSYMFTDALNDAAPLFFDEAISFDVGVSGRDLGIICRRKGSTYDARTLSGAEGKCFTLAELKAILPLLPMSRRTNILVLDEIESGMSEPKMKLFERNLSVLCDVVPHVFISSPLTFNANDARVVTVERRNGISQIVE